MTIEALILGCGVMTRAHADYIRANHTQYSVRAVACANLRVNEDRPKPPPIKGLDDVPAHLKEKK